jgi:uncharacterized membrane protein YeaQ/YmgE (transglycosylase-associated protein family)
MCAGRIENIRRQLVDWSLRRRQGKNADKKRRCGGFPDASAHSRQICVSRNSRCPHQEAMLGLCLKWRVGRVGMGGIIWFLLVGMVVGWLAGVLVKGSGFGIVGDIVVGVAGAAIGWFLLSVIGFLVAGLMVSMLVAVMGAVIFILLARMVGRL